MPMVVKCPHCQAKLRPPGDRTGTTVFQCPRCTKILTLPSRTNASTESGPVAPLPTASEPADPAATDIPSATETESDLPVFPGVDPESALPPLLEDEPHHRDLRPIQPHVVTPDLGARAIDLAEALPEPPAKKKLRIAVGNVHINPVRLAVAVGTITLILVGAWAAYYLVTNVMLQ